MNEINSQIVSESTSIGSNLSIIEIPPRITNPRKTEENFGISITANWYGDSQVRMSIQRPILDEHGKFTYETTSNALLIFERELRILNHSFLISNDDQGYYIYHRRWALSGEGRTLQEAREDLIKTIIHLRNSYAESPIEELTIEAVEFRNYLLHILPA